MIMTSKKNYYLKFFESFRLGGGFREDGFKVAVGIYMCHSYERHNSAGRTFVGFCGADSCKSERSWTCFEWRMLTWKKFWLEEVAPCEQLQNCYFRKSPTSKKKTNQRCG